MDRSARCFDLTIVLPRYREGVEVIRRTLQRLAHLGRQLSLEIIVVNDGGSTDFIAVISKDFPEVTITNVVHNRGKGHAIKGGVDRARGNWILYSDIDLPISSESILAAIEKLHELQACDFIVGNRCAKKDPASRQANVYRRATGRCFRRLFNLLCEPTIKDSQCPFKIISCELARQLFSSRVLDGYAFDAEIIHIARLLGRRPYQHDVEWEDTRASWTAGRTALVFLKMVADLLTIKVYWIVFRSRLARLPKTPMPLVPAIRMEVDMPALAHSSEVELPAEPAARQKF